MEFLLSGFFTKKFCLDFLAFQQKNENPETYFLTFHRVCERLLVQIVKTFVPIRPMIS